MKDLPEDGSLQNNNKDKSVWEKWYTFFTIQSFSSLALIVTTVGNQFVYLQYEYVNSSNFSLCFNINLPTLFVKAKLLYYLRLEKFLVKRERQKTPPSAVDSLNQEI